VAAALSDEEVLVGTREPLPRQQVEVMLLLCGGVESGEGMVWETTSRGVR
jgi:hypothetical protein